jgi:hypothetical protein
MKNAVTNALTRLFAEIEKFNKQMGRTGDRPWINFLGGCPVQPVEGAEDLRQAEEDEQRQKRDKGGEQ